ncbi:MAG: hypothetical protein IT518_28970 [Burkholderiales bacterium]|nr:hypothetical protein [Burkholderiales bacterium]
MITQTVASAESRRTYRIGSRPPSWRALRVSCPRPTAPRQPGVSPATDLHTPQSGCCAPNTPIYSVSSSTAAPPAQAGRRVDGGAEVIRFTEWPNVKMTAGTTREMPWTDFVAMLNSVPVIAEKVRCAVVKLATFNGPRSDAALAEVTGVELDFDAGTVSIDHAAARLDEFHIRAVLYTSHSHTPERPRWRVLAPLARPCPPLERAHFLARLNGALCGIAAPESFTPAQPYFIGRAPGAEYKVIVTGEDGSCIDELDELDKIAIGKPRDKTQGAAVQTGSRENWLADLLNGDDVHGNALRVVGSMVARGLDDETIEAVFESFFDAIAKARGFDRATALVHSGELDRMIAGARRKGFEPATGVLSIADRLEQRARAAQQAVDTHHLLNGPREMTIAALPEAPTVVPCPSIRFRELCDALAALYGIGGRGAEAVALAAVSTWAAREYAEPVHLPIIVCGRDDREAAQKGAGREVAARVRRAYLALTRATGHRSRVWKGRIGTFDGLMKRLYREPALCYAAGDIAALGETALRQNTGSIDHLWAEIANECPTAMDFTVDASSLGQYSTATVDIEAPALSVFVTVGDERLEGLFNTRGMLYDYTCGAVWLDVRANGEMPQIEPENASVPPWIVDRAREIVPLKAPMACLTHEGEKEARGMPLPSVGAPEPRPGRDCLIDDDVLRVLEDMSTEAARRNARRIAQGVACWESPDEPRVTGELMRWARTLVIRAEWERAEHAAVQVNERGQRADADLVVEVVARSRTKGVTKTEIGDARWALKKLSAEQLSELLSKLCDESDGPPRIVCARSGRGSRYYLPHHRPVEKSLARDKAA